MREMNATGGWGVVCTENIEISEGADIFRELVRLQKQSRRELTAALGLLMARWRLRALAAACPLIVAERAFNQQCPFFQRIGLLAEAKPTWLIGCPWSSFDP